MIAATAAICNCNAITILLAESILNRGHERAVVLDAFISGTRSSNAVDDWTVCGSLARQTGWFFTGSDTFFLGRERGCSPASPPVELLAGHGERFKI